MKVLFFASLAEITGKSELEISGVTSVADLKAALEKQFPGIESLKYAIAVNNKIVNGDQLLNDKDEIAFLPPFSGG